MKLVSSLLVLTCVSGYSAIYTMNLGSSPQSTPIDGLDGWVQSEPNYSDGETYPRSWVQISNSSRWLALGGYYDSELPVVPASGVSVSRGVSSIGLNYSSLSLAFAMVDSITRYPDEFPADVDRNRFSIGLFNAAGTELVSVVFVPNSQSGDPSGELASWNMHVSSGGVQIAPAFVAVLEGLQSTGQGYSMLLTTNPGAVPGSVDFGLSVSSETNTVSTSGSLAGLAGQQISQVRIGWGIDGAEVDGLGSNFLMTSDLTLSIPEPSALIFCLCSVLPLALMRRRTV